MDLQPSNLIFDLQFAFFQPSHLKFVRAADARKTSNDLIEIAMLDLKFDDALSNIVEIFGQWQSQAV